MFEDLFGNYDWEEEFWGFECCDVEVEAGAGDDKSKEGKTTHAEDLQWTTETHFANHISLHSLALLIF